MSQTAFPLNNTNTTLKMFSFFTMEERLESFRLRTVAW